MLDKLIGCVQHDCDKCMAQTLEIERLRADAARYRWLLPVIADSTDSANDRAGALMWAKFSGKTGSEIVDAAMKETP